MSFTELKKKKGGGGAKKQLFHTYQWIADACCL